MDGRAAGVQSDVPLKNCIPVSKFLLFTLSRIKSKYCHTHKSRTLPLARFTYSSKRAKHFSTIHFSLKKYVFLRLCFVFHVKWRVLSPLVWATQPRAFVKHNIYGCAQEPLKVDPQIYSSWNLIRSGQDTINATAEKQHQTKNNHEDKSLLRCFLVCKQRSEHKLIWTTQFLFSFATKDKFFIYLKGGVPVQFYFLGMFKNRRNWFLCSDGIHTDCCYFYFLCK